MPRPARRNQAAPPASQSITNFTRISKSQASNDAAGKKIIAEPKSTVTTRKRKAAAVEENAHPKTTARTFSFAPSSDDGLAGPIKRARRQEPVASPVIRDVPITKGKRTAKTTPSRTKTAHKPIASTVISENKRQGKTVQTKLDGVFKKLSKPAADKDALPAHLAEIVDIHRAFVKTIMIQFAHNGSNSPIDLRTLIPHISQSWGKRQVTIEDIRRCIAIQTSTKHDTQSPFMITDYGRGKICVERSVDMAPINEERLLKQFEINLRALGAERSADEMDVDLPLDNLSLNELPQVAIKNMDIGIKANPLFNKGQRALSELKSVIAAKEQEKEAKQTAASNNPLLNPDGTKMSLLDRLRLKQLAKANGPLPPSGPELQRRAALNRVGDIAATISMLSLSNPMSLPRQAFTMAVILEKLKDSLRVPVSKEEGASCVRLIASEIAPEWLRIITIGGRENVVVQRNSQPVDRVLQERVQKLLG
ncbi:hypothetical protein FSARC_9895 [Fusarium sarcochroum]|uniref:DNA replication factor Cdt1 C-terminal domain-containing protein n=1 Tax=Fusarium sarcochroum TaxID=1208366 RepID=A0A8H4TQD1_9HYPO|nr:hypothetical protein FSARC_9895 [Fusarium sarcochroum]